MDQTREPAEVFRKFRTFVWLSPMKGTYGVYFMQPSELMSVAIARRAGEPREAIHLFGRSLAVALTSAMRTTPTPVFGIAFPDGIALLYRKVVFDVERVGSILSSSMSSAMAPVLQSSIPVASEFYEFPSSEVLARFLQWHQSQSQAAVVRVLGPTLDNLGISDRDYNDISDMTDGFPQWITGGIMEYWTLVSGRWELRIKEGAMTGSQFHAFVVKAL